MGEKVYAFNPFRRDMAILYHKTFHYSFELHVNHMVFLHLYIYGLLLVCSLWGWLAIGLCLLPFVAYSYRTIRPLPYACAYIIGLCAIGVAAFYTFDLFVLEHDVENFVVGIMGASIVLFSLCCQVLGHHFYEEYSAPPDLVHGFLTAPALEMQSFLYRSGLVSMAKDLPDLAEQLAENRAALRRLEEERVPQPDVI